MEFAWLLKLGGTKRVPTSPFGEGRSTPVVDVRLLKENSTRRKAGLKGEKLGERVAMGVSKTEGSGCPLCVLTNSVELDELSLGLGALLSVGNKLDL